MHKNMSEKGFTLIEFIVASGIFFIVGVLLLSVIVTGQTSASVAQAMIFLNTQARQAALNLSNEFSEARLVSVVLETNGVRFMVPVTDSAGNLRYTPGGSVQFGDGQVQGNSIRYILSGANLFRQILDANQTLLSERAIAQNVTNFTVAFTAGTYTATIGLRIDNFQGRALPNPINFNTNITVTPRN